MNNQAAQTPTPAERGLPEDGSWIAADDVYRHARSIDVALNGEEGAASRPALCDVVAQIASLARQYGPLVRALSARPLPSDWVAADCEKCGREAVHYLVMDNLPQPGRRMPFCEYCTQEHEANAQEVNDHEMRHFGGSYGLVTYHYEPLAAAPSAPAEAVERRPLSERLYRGSAHPEAHRERFMEGSTAPEPLAQGPFRDFLAEAKELMAKEYERFGATHTAKTLRNGDPIWNDSYVLAAVASSLVAASSYPSGMVLVPAVMTTDMDEAGEQELALGNDFSDAWEAAIATYLFDKENGNG